jgi:tetratricopeptide (TPR) repeat protein
LDAGTALIDGARALNPNLAIAWSFSAWARVWLGEPELAIDHGMRAMRLSPLDPLLHSTRTAIAWAHFIAGRYEAAVFWGETAQREMGHFQGALRIQAASHALLGRLEEAQNIAGQIRQLYPELRITDAIETSPFRRAEDLSRYTEGLRIAGIPK